MDKEKRFILEEVDEDGCETNWVFDSYDAAKSAFDKLKQKHIEEIKYECEDDPLTEEDLEDMIQDNTSLNAIDSCCDTETYWAIYIMEVSQWED